ncbi:MAG TPA: nucleotidyltransferase domain-containing protein [Lachnospiraceae bacterium]|nr:nucleotidyltransferase domain-containing protein [Lachnospiraceae bacterium]
MYNHHKLAIETVTNKLKLKENILGVIIGGSVAHGFAGENSDIDLMLVLSDEDYKKAIETGDINYYETEATPYEGGYVDGKYTSIEFIKKTSMYGSEPARFAFKDAFVTYSKIEGLEELVKDACRYPLERKIENMEKFYAQFEAWRWYYYEGMKRNDEYLISISISNYVLFAGRLILAYNETLFPYHKWFMRVLEEVSSKPDNLLQYMNKVLETKSAESVELLYNSIVNFHTWTTSDKHWCIRFMMDSELNWLEGCVPIADL